MMSRSNTTDRKTAESKSCRRRWKEDVVMDDVSSELPHVGVGALLWRCAWSVNPVLDGLGGHGGVTQVWEIRIWEGESGIWSGLQGIEFRW